MTKATKLTITQHQTIETAIHLKIEKEKRTALLLEQSLGSGRSTTTTLTEVNLNSLQLTTTLILPESAITTARVPYRIKAVEMQLKLGLKSNVQLAVASPALLQLCGLN